MRIGPRTFAAVVLLVSLALARASAQEAVHGTWSIEPGGNGGSEQIHLAADDGRSHDSSSFDIRANELGIARALSAPNASDAKLTIVREAGSLAAAGTAGRDIGSGTFVFTPSAAFRSAFRDRGYSELDSWHMFSAFSVDLTTEFLDGVGAAGYAHLPFEHAIAFRALGIDGAYIKRVQAHGFTHLPIEKLIQLKAMGVVSARFEGTHA